MRTLIWFMLILTIPMLSISGDEIKSGWASSQLTIDGDGDEWKDLTFSYYDNDKTAIAVKNDSTAVYLMIISRDERTVMQIEHTGIVVWLNTNGKKKDDYGLRYLAGRLSKEPRKFQRGFDPPPGMGERLEEMETNRAKMRKLITVIDHKETTEIPSKSENGPAAAATFANDIYAMEFRIPIVSSREQGVGLVFGEEPDLVLGLEFGYLTQKEKSEMRARAGGPDGGFQVGGGGMGIDGGGPQRMKGMRADMQRKIWIEVELAEM